MCTNLGSENPNERDKSQDLRVDGRIILEWILKKLDGRLWNGFIWLRIGTNDGLF
jgi:hypothetical protein